MVVWVLGWGTRPAVKNHPLLEPFKRDWDPIDTHLILGALWGRLLRVPYDSRHISNKKPCRGGSPQDPQESEKRWCPTPCCFGCGTMRLIQERTCKNGVRSFHGRIWCFSSWFWYQTCFPGRFLSNGVNKWYSTFFFYVKVLKFGTFQCPNLWMLTCTTSRRSSRSFNSNVISKIS